MKKVIIFNAQSTLGFFQRPESNNNPSTFEIIPKSAVIEIISAVIGWDRDFMNENNMYKILTEKLSYSIRPRSEFQIKCWSEYDYKNKNIFQEEDKENYYSVYIRNISGRLVDVNYDIYIMYNDTDNNICALLCYFAKNIEMGEFVFPPHMGMANYPAKLTYLGEFVPQKCNGKFNTNVFVPI